MGSRVRGQDGAALTNRAIDASWPAQYGAAAFDPDKPKTVSDTVKPATDRSGSLVFLQEAFESASDSPCRQPPRMELD
jgi:hypothetical protein